MNKRIITVASRLHTMEQVDAIEAALIEFGVNDKFSRPRHFATNYTDHTSKDPLAVVFLYIQTDQSDPSYFYYSFDAGYRTSPSEKADTIHPDTFLALVKLAIILKQQGRIKDHE